MILTFAEDFTSQSNLDSELLGTPESGLFYNRGVYPIVTVDNILALLPFEEITFADYDVATVYGKFTVSRKRSDVVASGGKIYQSLIAVNSGNAVTDSTKWLETNIESLRIKAFLWSVEDNAISALSLNRKLVENQYIYHVGENVVDLPNDFSAWAFEPKGSDYVKIRINEMSLQANTLDPVDVTVINQGKVIDTITLNPDNGILSFEDVGYVIEGKGKFIFAFPSQSVLSDSAYNDALKYSGFVCYPMNGIGDTPEDAEYTFSSSGNGLGFNVSAYLDTTKYISNNKIDFGKMFRSQMEMDFGNMVISNANSQVNRNVRMLNNKFDKNVIYREITVEEGNTIAARYRNEKHSAKTRINRSFDKFLGNEKSFKVSYEV